MLEATPGRPWGINLKDLLDVEQDMKWRYWQINLVLFEMLSLTRATDAQSPRNIWKLVNFPSH